MFSIENRRQRLLENCSRFWVSSAETQYLIINSIIADSQILRVKMSDYLASTPTIGAGNLENDYKKCPYCMKNDCKGEFGLRTHVSRVHRNKFVEFKKEYL